MESSEAQGSDTSSLFPDTYTIIEEVRLSEITKSTSETKPSNSDPSSFENQYR